METSPARALDILTDHDGWAALDTDGLCTACLDAAFEELSEARLRQPVSVLLTGDEKVRELNRSFRSKDRPTNVLSFPAGGLPGLPDDAQPLGDLALAFETCAREAADKDLPLRNHAAHLLVHGLLHLLGYDHQTDGEAETMERAERLILARLGISDPYGDE